MAKTFSHQHRFFRFIFDVDYILCSHDSVILAVNLYGFDTELSAFKSFAERFDFYMVSGVYGTDFYRGFTSPISRV